MTSGTVDVEPLMNTSDRDGGAADAGAAYGALNAASYEIADVMNYLLDDGSATALRLWGRLESVKGQCDAVATSLLKAHSAARKSGGADNG